MDFLQFFKGDNFCDFLFAFLHTQFSSEKGSTLKGKNLLPREQILSFENRPISVGRQNNMIQLSP